MLATASTVKKPTKSGRFFSIVVTPPYLPRWIAIIFTLALHLLMLSRVIHGGSLRLPEDLMMARLQYIKLPSPEKPTLSRLVEPPLVSPLNPDIKLLADSFLPLPAIIVQSEPLTREELQELVGEPNYIPQHETADIAKNVFHPGLRKQLTIEANKPVLARAEDQGLETYMDSSGATIVKLSDGSCLKSPPVKIGEPQNWYMAPCAGKNESEKIMDRVNQAINGKLRLNE